VDRFPVESLESTTIARATTDEDRPGRPRRLSNEHQNEVKRQLYDPPIRAGINAPAGTPVLLQLHLRDTFDVEYSRPGCRRLLNEAGLTYQEPRRSAAEAEPEERVEFVEALTISGGR
jgi:transposase